MRAGDLHTGFSGQHSEALFRADAEAIATRWLLACVGRLEARRLRALADPSPWSDTSAFRVNQPNSDRLSFLEDGSVRGFQVTFDGARTFITVPGRRVSVRDVALVGSRLTCELDDRRLACVYVEEPTRCTVLAEGGALEATFATTALADDQESDASRTVRAPMPGKIHAVLVGEGDRVVRGQPLLSLEAMKMEHTLRAESAGTVASLHARVGEQVDEGQLLLALRDNSEET
jgi:3-methylcrotonyl-CoA carboxylase alpha subunit